MDNLGKCHGKINTVIGLEANGNSSNWLRTVFHGTYDVHMSITNKLNHGTTKGSARMATRTHPVPVSTTPRALEHATAARQLGKKSEAIRKEKE